LGAPSSSFNDSFISYKFVFILPLVMIFLRLASSKTGMRDRAEEVPECARLDRYNSNSSFLERSRTATILLLVRAIQTASSPGRTSSTTLFHLSALQTCPVIDITRQDTRDSTSLWLALFSCPCCPRAALNPPSECDRNLDAGRAVLAAG
jgi:hypothetical protein